MKITETELSGVYFVEPRVFEDDRGYFFESYNQRTFELNGLKLKFLQDNQSKSQKGVLRGLHFQHPPASQGKLVQVIRGSVLDVAVDIRRGSLTYGQHLSVVLSEQNKRILYISEGFAHGFLTLEDDTIFSYKCTNIYDPKAEAAILWNDLDLGINWNIQDPIVSSKDANAIPFNKFKSQFSI